MSRDAGVSGTSLVLVTGATGYIGGRLVPVLEGVGVRLRCLARQPAALAARVSPTTEVVAGDLLDRSSLDRACRGADAILTDYPLELRTSLRQDAASD